MKSSKEEMLQVSLNISDQAILNDCLNRIEFEHKSLPCLFKENFVFVVLDFTFKVSFMEDNSILSVYNKSMNKYYSKINISNIPKAITIEGDRPRKKYEVKFSNEDLCEIFKKYDLLANYKFILLYHIVSYLLYYYKDILPCRKTFSKNKKGKKIISNVYTITDEIIAEKVVYKELDLINYSNISNVPVILSNYKASEFLLDKYDNEFMKEKVLVPFEEFVLQLNDDNTLCHCKIVDTEKMVINIYKDDIHLLGLLSYLTDISNGINFVTKDYKKIECEFEIGSLKYIDQIRSKAVIYLAYIYVNMYFISRYSVKKEYIKKDKKEMKENKENKQFEKTSSDNLDDNSNLHIHYHELPQRKKVYVYSVIESITKIPKKRSKPKYVKNQWLREGHYRHYKSGKVVWIEKSVCNRKQSITQKPDIYSIDTKKI